MAGIEIKIIESTYSDLEKKFACIHVVNAMGHNPDRKLGLMGKEIYIIAVLKKIFNKNDIDISIVLLKNPNIKIYIWYIFSIE